MRRLGLGIGSILLVSALFSSCTCNRQAEAPPTVGAVPKSGFDLGEKKNVGGERAQAATPTAAKTPEQVAQPKTSPSPEAQMPPDFPADVPVFKDAAVAQVQDLANNAHNVIFHTA